MTNLLNSLRNIVGTQNLLSQSEAAQRASHVWDARPLQAMALVKPANTKEVSAVLAACHAANQSVVTHGGRTGLADGEKSTTSDIVLSLERMNQIESIDTSGATITVEAGCVLDSVHAAAVENGFMYGVDLGARGSCTLGGNISTNAGGLSVLRYGMTREQVLGLEVVLADGTVLTSMNSMMKNNSGYDLKHLFIGSEGTLGVITRAVLRLRQKTHSVNTCLLAFNRFEQANKVLQILSAKLNAQLNAFEIIWNPYFQLVTDPDISGTAKAPLDRDYPVYAIAEARGTAAEDDKALFERVLENILEEHLLADAVIAQSEQERKNIWHIRENLDPLLSFCPNYNYDVSLPIASMQSYVEGIESEVQKKWPTAKCFAYGHMADCNLHITIVPFPEYVSESFALSNYNAPIDQKLVEEYYEQCNQIVFEPLKPLGGSISAEHGIGTLKKQYLPYSRTSAELALMRSLKNTLDPSNILNPGKVV